jgi:hypothetical protein
VLANKYDFLSQFPYSFVIRTKKGLDLLSLPEKGVRTAHVHISRFPKLIEFIRHNEDLIPGDLWGLLYGYPLSEIHQFTYDWEAWVKEKKPRPPKRADGYAKAKAEVRKALGYD